MPGRSCSALACQTAYDSPPAAAEVQGLGREDPAVTTVHVGCAGAILPVWGSDGPAPGGVGWVSAG